MASENTINYHLYIDECGDQNLETFSPTFPIFTLFCVDNLCPEGNGRLSAIVERRGKREDKKLQDYYHQLLEKGTCWVTAERMKSRMSGIDFKWKSDDIAGLQIADLIVYPLTRHVLNPKAVNLAYDVLEPNIFMEAGKLMGLKIYPTQQI